MVMIIWKFVLQTASFAFFSAKKSINLVCVEITSRFFQTFFKGLKKVENFPVHSCVGWPSKPVLRP